MNYVQQIKAASYLFGTLGLSYYFFKHCIYFGKALSA
jgi:hypothetical protein